MGSTAVLVGVLVGCAHHGELEDRPTITAGVDDLRVVLTDPHIGGFADDRCLTVHDPTHTRGVVETLLAAARSTTDTLHYAGHGLLDDRNQIHLAVSSSSSDRFLVPDTALNFDRIRAVLRLSTARNKIVILDCCFAGRAIQDLAGPADLTDLTSVQGAYVLTATNPPAAALTPPDTQYTAFTGALVDLLRTGIPAGPDLLTLDVLFAHLRHALVSRGLPEPHHQGTDTVTKLALVRNRGRDREDPPGIDGVGVLGGGRPGRVAGLLDPTDPDVRVFRWSTPRGWRTADTPPLDHRERWALDDEDVSRSERPSNG